MDTRKVYNDNAAKWLRLEPSSLSDFTARPAVFDACGDLAGRSVLDLGCGEGYCARELKRRGAGDYLGVDLSAKMIEAGRQREAEDKLGIEYRVGNAAEFVPDRKFDVCIAVFLFNYLRVDAMRRVISTVYDALLPGGQFVFSVPHPVFPFIRQEQEAPFYFSVDGMNYYDAVDQQFEGEIWKQNGETLHVQCVHKTFADYFQSLQYAGFSHLPELQELTVTRELIEQDTAFFSPLKGTPLHVLFNISK